MSYPQIIPAARIIHNDRLPRQGSGWRLAAGLAAVALAISLAMPTPARAEAKDVPNGLISLAVLGGAQAGKAPQDQKAEIMQVRDDRWPPKNGWGQHDKPRRIPSVCAIEIDGERDLRMFSENCMAREGFRAKLPRNCATSARIFGERDRLYRAGCLRDAGFDMPRRN